MSRDPEGRDFKISKYISKYKATYRNETPPPYHAVAKIIDKWDSIGRNITYPLGGIEWNELKFKNEYDREQKIVDAFGKNLFKNQRKVNSRDFLGCASAHNCPRKLRCKSGLLYLYAVKNNFNEYSCFLTEPENCENFMPIDSQE